MESGGVSGGVSSQTLGEIDEAKEREDLKKIEAALFVSGRYLSIQDLISYTDLNPIIIRELVEDLRERYDKNESALEIVKKEDSWKMDVRQEFSKIINRFATGSSEFSKAEQETLAIIAYKQPIKQSVIIKIRGNKAYDHIKKFVELGLLKKKRVGHTSELTLSEDFYDYFSVKKSGDGVEPKMELINDDEESEDANAEDSESEGDTVGDKVVEEKEEAESMEKAEED